MILIKRKSLKIDVKKDVMAVNIQLIFFDDFSLGSELTFNDRVGSSRDPDRH